MTHPHSAGADVHDGRDDGLEVALHDAVDLEALPGRGPEVVLSVLVAQVVHQAVQLWCHLSGRGPENVQAHRRIRARY